jgi:hypothetical protein
VVKTEGRGYELVVENEILRLKELDMDENVVSECVLCFESAKSAISPHRDLCTE